MRYQLWDWNSNERIGAYRDEDLALERVRAILGAGERGLINKLGLVDKGGPGEVLRYPLEGAALLAQAFGLEAGE